jgi:hypothetical protein
VLDEPYPITRGPLTKLCELTIMTRSFVAAFLFLLALVQLPFTFVGVSMAVGYALDGPSYFYELHRSLAEADPLGEAERSGYSISQATGLESAGVLPASDDRQERGL